MVCLLIALAVQATPLTHAFVDVSVVPMDRERVLEHQTVVVSSGRIASVAPAAGARIPPGAIRIDGRGRFLIPGLGDAHLHLSMPGGTPALAEAALSLSALHGVTMARSMYTEPHHRDAAERAVRGDIVGPRLVLVAPALNGQNAATPAAAREAVVASHVAGYRVVKVLPGLSRETLDTVLAEARRLGMPVTGHVPAAAGLQAALAGFQSIEHLDGMLEALVPSGRGTGVLPGFFGLGLLDVLDESLIGPVVAAVRAAGVVIVPTEAEMELFVSSDSAEALARLPEMRLVPAALVARWSQQKAGFARNAGVTPERAARYRALRRRFIAELQAAGVTIAAGSDGFNLFDVPGGGLWRELETLVASGLSPWQALRAGTVNVARLMGLDEGTGTIAAGRTADLVLLEANPLIDIAAVRRQAGVMVRGRWLPRAEIDSTLLALVRSN